MDKYNHPEILAPAGSMEAFYSAVANGCDAVYLGGRQFGARAYANNFDMEQLKGLIRYAHVFGVRVYYTLNTLVKDIEMEELRNVLEGLACTDVDALLLQDLGVYRLIREEYPDFVIHSSTQMNLHSEEDVEAAMEMGFDRLVLSRECSLADIRSIKERFDIEIEAFVHGALCYSYSGQCLMSSIYGGRSGNRGKCAQPCRLAYDIDGEQAYYLSPKDQMTLYELPKLIEAGIDSFKIEGRMKSPEYVGFAVSLYWKYRNLALDLMGGGRIDEYKVEDEDVIRLAQLFNRGNFTSGYYERHNDKSMVSFDHSKNYGVKVGTVKADRQGFHFRFEKEIAEGDLLELHLPGREGSVRNWPDIRLNQNIRKGRFNAKSLDDSEGKRIGQNLFPSGSVMDVHRIVDVRLLESLQAKAHERQLPINGKVEMKIGHPVRLTVWTEAGLTAVHEAGEVQKASKRPVTPKDIEKQLKKTRNTSFFFNRIDHDIEGECFIPMGVLNGLRREILERLENVIIEEYNRITRLNARHVGEMTSEREFSDKKEAVKAESGLSVYVRTYGQTKAMMEFLMDRHRDELQANGEGTHAIRRIYVDITDLDTDLLKDALLSFRNISDRLQVYLALPHVMFGGYTQMLRDRLSGAEPSKWDGFLVRTIGQINMVKDYGKPVVTDYNVHCFNKEAMRQLRAMGASQMTLSLELNRAGNSAISSEFPGEAEILVYGRIALMHSANCVYRTRYGTCSPKKDGHLLELLDRKGMALKVACHCNMCYNTIYNSIPLMLLDKMTTVNRRIDFTTETGSEVRQLIDAIGGVGFDPDRHTRGHYNRGVK